MSKSVQQIEKDLTDLESQVSQLAINFLEKYQQYLEILSKIARQQLILASYQICTEIYAQNYLILHKALQQNLQENIRKCANDLQVQIKTLLDLEQPERPSYREEITHITRPDHLINWLRNIEQKTHQILNQQSTLLNQYFIEKRILSDPISPQLVEIAIQTQGEGGRVNSSANLLEILIGEEPTSESLEVEEPKVNKVIIVHIKLAELEFNNSNLGAEHQQIRTLYERLKSVAQLHQQKQKELVIAQAQTAWRSLWYDVDILPTVNG